MIFRSTICFCFGFFLLAVLLSSLFLPLHDANNIDLQNRSLAPNPNQLLGTDVYGRDLLLRFFAGGKYTILTSVVTVILATASGLLMAEGSRAMPKSCKHLLTALAYGCYVAPSFLLAPGWVNRLVMTLLCILPVVPQFTLALILVSTSGSTGWTTSLVLGPLWGIGIAYYFRSNRSFIATAPLLALVFAWSVLQHGVLDYLGIGVQAPQPSWGTLLFHESQSFWPGAAATVGFLVVVTFAFSLSDMVSRKT